MSLKRPHLIALGAGLAALAGGAAYLAVSRGGPPEAYEPPLPFSHPDHEYPFTPEEFRTQFDHEFEDENPEEMSPKRRRRALIHEEWAEQAEFVPLSRPVSELVELWAPQVGDSRELLTPAQERAALRTIAEHCVARAQPTPEQFRALIERNPTRRWRPTMEPRLVMDAKNLFYDMYLGGGFDPETPTQDMLDDIWAGLVQHDHLFEAVGHGPRGAHFIGGRVRAADMISAMLWDGPDAPENPGYWSTGSSRTPMWFTEQTTTIEEEIQANDLALVFIARVIVRLEDGRLALWRPKLFFDEETGGWALDSAYSSSNRAVMIAG